MCVCVRDTCTRHAGAQARRPCRRRTAAGCDSGSTRGCLRQYAQHPLSCTPPHTHAHSHTHAGGAAACDPAGRGRGRSTRVRRARLAHAIVSLARTVRHKPEAADQVREVADDRRRSLGHPCVPTAPPHGSRCCRKQPLVPRTYAQLAVHLFANSRTLIRK